MITKFKIFEGDGEGLINSKEEINKAHELGKKLLGKLFRIYPTRNPNEMIAISKLNKIIGVNKNWGDYSGYIIHPESSKGKYYSDSEFITDYISEMPTEEEIEFYNKCEKLNKFNI